MNPRMSRAHAAIGDALLMLGRNEEAHTEYAAEPVDDFRLAGEAIVERKLGNLAAAQAALTKLVKELGDRVLYQQAQVHAQWGELDAAIAKLRQARRTGDSGLIYRRNDPLLDPLRKYPRSDGLLGSIGFD
jgi:predicted negative regulator of RcsB-dependent stress response